MSAFSDYYENAIINHIRGTTFPAAPANTYISLHTADVTDAGTGTEVSGSNYARVAVPGATGEWDATSGTDGATENTNAITFPTASGSWGTITHFGIWDASSGGNLYYHGALTVSKTVGSGDTVSFPIGALDIVVS